ncbi:hypothetical protein M2347_001954 [Chryseobacterium sp. H1D6B]|nr:hypothetical protein [Chryseobacterium sp. H1D6B]
MKNLIKISRENLKSVRGSGNPMCPDDPAFMQCYSNPGFPNGFCVTRYRCCIMLGMDPEECKDF